MLKTFKYFSLFIVFAVKNSCLAQISTFGDIPVYYPSNFQPAFSTATGAKGAFASSLETTQPSSLPPSFRTFTSTFKSAVDSSPVLPDVFDLGLVDLHAFSDFLFNAMYTHVFRGFYDPHDIASYVNRPITEKSTIPTYPMLVNMYASTIGNQLLEEGLLNDMNAASFGFALAREMEISAQKIAGLNYPEYKFQALANGFIDMLKSLGLFTIEKLHVVDRYFTKEVRLAVGGSDSRAEGRSKKAGRRKSANF